MRTMKLSRRAAVASALAGAAAAAAPARAQDLQPGKPITIVAPFGPGTTNDIIARLLAQDMTVTLGQSVIVENRPGATGNIGADYVAKARPDGHTVVIASLSNILNQATGNATANLLADFTPVCFSGGVLYALLVPNEFPAKNVAEFIRHAKSNPGKMNYATAGNGSATHLSMAYFNGLAGIDLVHVPFKATGEAVNEVLVGRAQAVIAANIGAIPYVKDARVRLIGVTSAKRSKFLPEIPAIAESGLPGYAFDSWFGLLGPAGTPKPVVDQVNAAMARLLKDPVILDRLAKQGIEPQAMTSDEFNRLLRADFERMSKVVKASGARVD